MPPAHVVYCWQEPQKHCLLRVVRAWKSIAKKNTISSCSSSEKVLLNFKTIQFCCLSSEAFNKSREVIHLASSLWGNLCTLYTERPTQTHAHRHSHGHTDSHVHTDTPVHRHPCFLEFICCNKSFFNFAF